MKQAFEDYSKNGLGGALMGAAFMIGLVGFAAALGGAALVLAAFVGGTLLQGAAGVAAFVAGGCIVKVARVAGHKGRAIADDAIDHKPMTRFVAGVGSFALMAQALSMATAQVDFKKAASSLETQTFSVPALNTSVTVPKF